jgi:hypothetical protein
MNNVTETTGDGKLYGWPFVIMHARGNDGYSLGRMVETRNAEGGYTESREVWVPHAKQWGATNTVHTTENFIERVRHALMDGIEPPDLTAADIFTATIPG